MILSGEDNCACCLSTKHICRKNKIQIMEFEHDKTWKMQSTVAALILVCGCGICILAIGLVQAMVTYFRIHSM